MRMEVKKAGHNMKWTIFFAFALLPAEILGKAVTECRIGLDKDGRNTKVFTDVFKFTVPKRSGTAEAQSDLLTGQVTNFECAAGFARKDLPEKKYSFECVNGKYNRTLSLQEILCRSDYHKNSKAVQISPSELNSKIFKCDSNGWELYRMHSIQADGNRKHLYTICLDARTMRPKFVLQPSAKEKPPKALHQEERNAVWGFDGYGKTVDEMVTISKGYVENIQRTRITNSFPQKYDAQKRYPYYFNRGHLVPFADYADENDRKSTCEYINAAPQWDAFNKNSWSLVEREARHLRQDNPEDWEVYTGTYGTIPTQRGPLFVAPVFENGKFKKGLLPVPSYYWKYVRNIKDKTKSRVYLGVNNPEIRSPQEIKDKYKICTPLAIPNKNPIEGSEFFGFVYQCEVEEFLKALKTAESVIKDKYVL